jgi:two-component system nitrogen regulation response regulator GlnG
MNEYPQHTRGAAAQKPVWIVDDDRAIRWSAREGARARASAPVVRIGVRGAAGARDAAAQVLVSDIRMPGESGLALLNTVKGAIRSCR